MSAISLLVAQAPFALSASNAVGPLAPLEVSGIAGVTFLTNDLPAMERFYGQGAGFAEAPAGQGRTRFIVNADQWIEFQASASPSWPRRLLHLTLEAPNPESIMRSLRDRGVESTWIGTGAGTRILQLEDPVGNVIQVAPRWIPSCSLSAAAKPFSTHLQHMGFAVDRSKAEATIAFYRDTLGWPEAVRMSGTDGRLSLVKFRLPGPQRDLIELIFCDPPLNKWAAGAFDHVNFEVGDIDAAYRALERGGIANQEQHRPTVNGEHLWAINIIDPELTRVEVQVLSPASAPIGTVSTSVGKNTTNLFDGRSLAGWEGNTGNWRVEDGAIVAGALDRRQPHNEFLATEEDFGNFDLRLQYRVEGTDGFVNGGVQFWSQRIPGNFEVSGYQADLGANTDGNLYDESRRGTNLAVCAAEIREKTLKPGAWNDYRIRANGRHIQIWLNGVQTVDYTEADPGIPKRGKFALQIHGGAKTRVSYRGLSLELLPDPANGKD